VILFDFELIPVLVDEFSCLVKGFLTDFEACTELG
jgi:hypothetical protein